MSRTFPVLRIFDYRKAIEFYVDWLGFKIDWEHRFGDNSPIYMQISKDDVILHLTEHHGDCSPGGKVYIDGFKDLKQYHKQLIDKNYKYNRPGLDGAFWKDKSMEVIDPFHNKLSFNESK